MLDRLANWLAARAPDPGVLAPRRRAFEAATLNRLTASWQSSGDKLDADLRAGLDIMRARSREVWQNNEYAKRFVAMVRANVVGPAGFKLMSHIVEGTARDTAAEAAVEDAWRDFCRLGKFEMSGRLSCVAALNTLVTHLAIDGELLYRFVEGDPVRNPYGVAVQLLDPARIDTRINRARSGRRNAIVMGVEIDEWRRPVNYWMRSGPTAADSEPWPARDLVHVFVPESAEQTRGVPWMHAAIRRLHDLGKYREAAVIAAWVGAAKMGFYQLGEDTDPEAIADGYQASDVPFSQVEAGEFGVLPHGTTFEAFDPDYPHDQFDAFIKAALRGVAAGLGVSYHGLSNDLTDVNFSSIRAGTLEERDQWRVLQHFFADAALEPIFERWISRALLRGAIKMPSGKPLPAAKLDKFRAHAWQPRVWEWVDPESDTNAVIAKIDNGLSTLTDECAKQGLDLEDLLRTRQREAELFERYGIARRQPDNQE